MTDKARHDFIEVSYVYIGAILSVLFLSLIATPLQAPTFGIVEPAKKEKGDLFQSVAFENVELRAKAFVVYDLVDKKIIASRNAETSLPLASLSKIMMAFTALSSHEKDAKVIIKPEDAEGGYDLGLRKNQVWSLGELLKYTLVFSSNDGAHAIANAFGGKKAFVEEMNKNSALLGLALQFTDPAGLDSGNIPGGKGSALDVAKLFAAARLRFPEILDATAKERVTVTASSGKVSGVPNTNQDIVNLLGVEASKTGFTDNAGGNLAVIVDITLGHPVAIVVLGSTRNDRFTDVEKLYTILLQSGKTKEK